MLSLLSLSVLDPTQSIATPPIEAPAVPHTGRWPGRSIAVIGSGRPAQTAVQNLERLATPTGSRPIHVHWLIDGLEPLWQSELDEILSIEPALTEVAKRFLAGASPRVLCWTEARVTAIEPTPNHRVLVRVSQPRDSWAVEVDRVLSLG